MAEYTTGHCPNHNQPGGCQLHNLQCGWPNCDRRQVQPKPPAGASGVHPDALPDGTLSKSTAKRVEALAASGGEDGWSLAMRVREALDRASCPDHFMRIAVETITGDAPQPPSAASVSERARASMKLLRFGRGNGLTPWILEPHIDGYWTPWHTAQSELDMAVESSNQLECALEQALAQQRSRPELPPWRQTPMSDLISNLQSMRDRMMDVLPNRYGDQFDGDFDVMLEAINALKRSRDSDKRAEAITGAGDG